MSYCSEQRCFGVEMPSGLHTVVLVIIVAVYSTTVLSCIIMCIVQLCITVAVLCIFIVKLIINMSLLLQQKGHSSRKLHYT